MNKINIFKKISILVLVLFTLLLIPNSKVKAFDLTATPTGISVTYYDDIDSRGFAWQTSTSVEESHLLVVKDMGNATSWDNATLYEGRYNDLNGFRCHRAHVCDLAPGKYYYKVGSPNAYSSVGSFTIDDSNDNKVSFTYVTDSQETSFEGFKQFNKTLTSAVTLNPDFIAFAGDLVDNSHANWGNDLSKIVMEEWAYAFDATKGVTMNYPMMSASGNHESAGFSYVYHNEIDYQKALSTGGYYSFDYENLHFVVLDTNVFESYNQTEIDEQLAWLEEDLATTDKEWKVVMLHIGAYSTGDHSHDASAKKIREILPPLFAKYKVDLVLQGHDHVYTRTMPYYYGEGENGKIPNRNEKMVEEDGLLWSLEPDGTYYITINYAGTKHYPPVDYDTSAIFPGKSPVNGKVMSQEIKNRMFAHVEIDGDELVLKSYISYEDGSKELYDYVAIKKNTYKEAINAIDKLGETVSVDDAFDLNKAYQLVNGLSERALAYVPEAKIAKLNGLLATLNLKDALAAHEAIEAIKKLNTTNYDAEFWVNYQTANEVYYSLTVSQMDLVYNKDILTDLKASLEIYREETIQRYFVEAVQELIDSIDSAVNKEKARIIAKMAYEALGDDLKAMIKNADILNQSFAHEQAPQNPAPGSTEEDDKGCAGAVVSSISAILGLGLCLIVIKRKRGED